MNVVIPNCHNYVIIIISVFHYSLHIAYFSVKFLWGHVPLVPFASGKVCMYVNSSCTCTCVSIFDI